MPDFSESSKYFEPYDWDKIRSDYFFSNISSVKAFAETRGISHRAARANLSAKDKKAWRLENHIAENFPQTPKILGVDKKLLDGLTPHEIYLCELLANFTDTRTKEQKAEAASYHPKSVYRFERIPSHSTLIYAFLQRNLSIALPSIYQALYNATSGKEVVAACRTLLQATGEIQSGTCVSTTVVQQNSSGSDEDKINDAAEFRRDRTKEIRRSILEDSD